MTVLGLASLASLNALLGRVVTLMSDTDDEVARGPKPNMSQQDSNPDVLSSDSPTSVVHDGGRLK